MSAQFLSIKPYKLSDARGIVSEALRVPSYCKHVNNPQAPSIVYSTSKSLKELPTLLRKLIKISDANAPRKNRKDALIFAAGTISYPKTPALAQSTDTEKLLYVRWKTLSMQFLKEQFGSDLFCVLEHVDERFPHLHFYVTPRLLPNFKIVMDAHPGRNSNLANSYLEGKEKQALYKKAMSNFLNLYYIKVGSKMGWKRKSDNPRKRVSREQWKQQYRPKSDAIILQQLGYSNQEIQDITGINLSASIMAKPLQVLKPRFH